MQAVPQSSGREIEYFRALGAFDGVSDEPESNRCELRSKFDRVFAPLPAVGGDHKSD